MIPPLIVYIMSSLVFITWFDQGEVVRIKVPFQENQQGSQQVGGQIIIFVITSRPDKHGRFKF